MVKQSAGFMSDARMMWRTNAADQVNRLEKRQAFDLGGMRSGGRVTKFQIIMQNTVCRQCPK